MPRYLLLFTPLLILGCGDQPKPETPDPPIVRAAECRWAKGPIHIDGRNDEEAWEQAQEMTGFSAWWDKKPGQTHTAAKLLWDENYFYFTADMEDYDLYADVTEHNGPTWNNDVFEIFLKPSANKPGYYEFQINAANTALEMFLPSRGAGGWNRFSKGPSLGLESSVRRRGTLNKFDDKDGGWTVEGRIPWTAFKPTGGRPEPGSKWKFALCRYDYSWTLEAPELTSTAPLTSQNFHKYEDYGELTFVK
jgi:hypothetical protein